MKGMFVVDTPQDYQAWLKERAELSGPAPAPAPARPPPRAASLQIRASESSESQRTLGCRIAPDVSCSGGL